MYLGNLRHVNEKRYYCCLRSGANIIDFLFSKVASDKNTKFTSRCRGRLNGYIMNKNSTFIYRCNSFIVDLRHKFTVRNMNEIPVFVQSSELSNRT